MLHQGGQPASADGPSSLTPAQNQAYAHYFGGRIPEELKQHLEQATAALHHQQQQQQQEAEAVTSAANQVRALCIVIKYKDDLR